MKIVLYFLIFSIRPTEVPNYSREEECYAKYPVKRRWKVGGRTGRSGTSGQSVASNISNSNLTDGKVLKLK